MDDAVPTDDSDLDHDQDLETADAPRSPITIGSVIQGLRERASARPRFALGIAVAVSLLLAAGTGYLVRDRGVADGIVAQVGDTEITEAALDQRIDALKALYGLKEPTAKKERDTFQRDAAKSAVVSMLIQQAAEKRDIVVTDKQVDNILAKLISERYPDGGRRAFVEALGVMGANEKQVREELRQQAIVAALFDDVTAGADVTDDEVRDAFLDRRDELATPEQRELLNVVVETKAEAQAVLRLLRQGKPFAEVAKTYSIDSATAAQGGKLGLATAADLDDAYAKAAFGAREGGLFGPVETETGWHVGRVAKAVPSTPASLTVIQPQLKQALETEEAVDLWRAFLGDLLAESDVQYHADFRPADPTSLPQDIEKQ
ncbi:MULTISPECIES: peptidyl-prolyl cis-trans isomerase [unclassified Nocardioides]|uniref:peptidyl-prolyl cis-trans isomerase n=1 Tax=unclassified Nocardioides TaxID=2615069 RepID=UPI00138ED784|nr:MULTISPECIES: peptidyl-prolyl cis-trans isomerase [unclassified Nocardioides]